MKWTAWGGSLSPDCSRSKRREGVCSAKWGKAGESGWARHGEGLALFRKFIHSVEGEREREKERDHGPFYKEVLSKNLIFSTEEKKTIYI